MTPKRKEIFKNRIIADYGIYAFESMMRLSREPKKYASYEIQQIIDDKKFLCSQHLKKKNIPKWW